MSHCSDMIMSEGGSSLSGSFHTDERRGDPLLLWFEVYRWVWRCQRYYGRMTWIERVRGRKKGESGPSITVLWGSLDSQRQTETQTHFSLPEDTHTYTHVCTHTNPVKELWNSSTTWSCIKFFAKLAPCQNQCSRDQSCKSTLGVLRGVFVCLFYKFADIWSALPPNTAGIAGEAEQTEHISCFQPNICTVCATTGTIWYTLKIGTGTRTQRNLEFNMRQPQQHREMILLNWHSKITQRKQDFRLT